MVEEKNILVAEDEKALANALNIKLSKEGYLVSIANNGQEAIDILQTEKFDLILLDLVMPIKGGFEVLEEMQTLGITIPVIVTTNLSQAEDKNKAEQYKVVDFFVKSNIPLSTIIDSINNHFNTA